MELVKSFLGFGGLAYPIPCKSTKILPSTYFLYGSESEAEYQRLLREASHNARDAAIIELYLQTGMRLSELAKLTLLDIEIPKRITQDIDNMGVPYSQKRRQNRSHSPQLQGM